LAASGVRTAFVTGGGGFVGRHLQDGLQERYDRVVAPPHEQLDLLDAEAVRSSVADAAPQAVYHLAALASVARSWEDPGRTLHANLAMTVNLLEAVRAQAPDAAVVLAGSSEVYGPPAELPVDEDAPLRPQNPYAVSKAACDLLAGQYADAHGLGAVRLRMFNQAGPGQSDTYVLASLARQVAEAELDGRPECLLQAGDVSAARDFTDVRDASRAYLAAPELEPGPYNVCSESAIPVSALIELLGQAARVPVRHEVDPARLRPGEVPEIRGSAARLRTATGWRPEIPLEQTVGDTLEDWRGRLAAARG
jgi:GDP-4-dehydro-6-deoxy-D-mannose reductase